MQPISCARHQFPTAIIQQASGSTAGSHRARDVEELLSKRGLDVSCDTTRRWVLEFGAAVVANLRRLRPRLADTWHLDVMVISTQGRRIYVWRAVDSEDEILDVLVPSRRDNVARSANASLQETAGPGWRRAGRNGSDPFEGLPE